GVTCTIGSRKRIRVVPRQSPNSQQDRQRARQHAADSRLKRPCPTHGREGSLAAHQAIYRHTLAVNSASGPRLELRLLAHGRTPRVARSTAGETVPDPTRSPEPL